MALKKWIISGIVSVGVLSLGFSQENLGYLMQPDVYENTIVFVAEGDLWKTSLNGGEAIRLTTLSLIHI